MKAHCNHLCLRALATLNSISSDGLPRGVQYLSGKRIGSGANIGLEALVLWTREVQNVGAAVEECGKQQTMLEDVRAKAQSPSTCATRSRCCWQTTWLDSTVVRRRSLARWRGDPVGCRCSRSSDWSQIEQWCGGMAFVGLEGRALGGGQVSGRR